MSLHNLGTIEAALGRGDRGRARFEEALELLRGAQDSSTEALCLAGLASTLMALEETEDARRRLQECLAILSQIDTPRERLYALEALAELAVALGRHLDAARFVGAAGAIREAHGMSYFPVEKIQVDRLLGLARENLGAAETDRASAEGRELPPEQVLADAWSMLEDEAAQRGSKDGVG